MAVMQIVPDLKVGGVQTSVVALCAALIARKTEVVLVALGPENELADALPKGPGLTLVVLDRKRRSVLFFPLFLWSVVTIVRELAAVMRRHGVTAVQGHMPNASLLGGLAAVLARVPKRFATFHSILFLPRKEGGLDRRNRLMLFTLKRMATVFTRYIAVSEAVRAALVKRGIPSHSVVTVPNGVAVADFDGVPDEERRALLAALGVGERRIVVCVGTLRDAKGHRYLIEAAVQLASEFPDLVYLLVGEGEKRAELEALTAEHGLERTIRFLGARRDVAALLSLGELFVLPSLWEGLPIALLEAMSMGLPCVATRVAGTVEVLRDGESGILVDPKDAALLAQGMRRMLLDRELAAGLGRGAREAAREHYGIDAMADRLLALFAA